MDISTKLFEIINVKPTLIIGSGFNRTIDPSPNALNDWSVLLEVASASLKLSSRKEQSNLLSFIFEDHISDYCELYNVASHVAEDNLKESIASTLIELSEAQETKQYLSMLAKFQASQVLSLNVDSLIVENIRSLKTSKTKASIAFETKADIDNLPIYYLNGNIKRPSHMNFGMRSLANQIVSYDKQFGKFKKLEKQFEYDKELVMQNDETWFSRFMYEPVLIVGASVGDHELALRYLFNQRKRNFAQHTESRSPVYIVLDKESVSNKKYLDELATMGIEPILFDGYKDFWKGIKCEC